MIKLLIFCLIIAPFSVVFSQHPTKKLAEQLLTDDELASTVVRNDGLSIDEVVRKIKAQSIDLNRDSKPEFILSGLICGQNCSYWIYRQEKDSYLKIPFEGSFQDLKVLATKTKGYQDLLGTRYWTCCEASLMTYQFDGSGYVETICKTQIDGYTDRRGIYRRYKFPKVTVGC
jgi:hypothetical protein